MKQKILVIVWRIQPAQAYEPCQVRKEAAINRNFCVASILHRVTKNKGENKWHIQLYTENLDL